MCRRSLLCSIELTLAMCTVEQKFETTRLAETFVETFGHLLITSNHLLYCLNPTCFVNHWNRSSEWQTMFCDFLTSYLCGALLLSNFRSESCRSHCLQSHSSKALFTDGSMFHWWSGRSWGPDGFRSFSFQHKKTSGWLSQNKLVSRLHPTALQINRLRVVNCVSVPCLAENRAQDHGQYNRFTTILFIALHVDLISGIC